MERKCKSCGKVISGKKLSFCSEECKSNYYNGKNFKKICALCGKEFKGSYHSKYCSKECEQSGRKLKINLIINVPSVGMIMKYMLTTLSL